MPNGREPPDWIGLARLGLLGISAALFQTLFAREFLSAFLGNEMVLASLLGAWLLGGGAGAALGSRVALAASAAVFLYGPLAVATLVAVRLLPVVFPTGSAPGAMAALVWVTLLLAPACLAFGAAFSGLAACLRPPAAGVAYLADSLGAAVAAAACSLFLIERAPAAMLLVAAGAAAALGCGRRAGGLVLGLAMLLALPVESIGRWATARQVAPLAVVARRESPHGAIVVGRASGQTTVLVDRLPVATSFDRAAAEETAHLPLALHPRPRLVAVIGVPPTGTLTEVARHGVERIDQVVEDAILLATLREVFPEFGDRRARLVADDPRHFLAARRASYDAIIVAAPEPASVEANRLYTVEFFGAAARALKPGGLLAVSLPGHAAYASDASRRFHSSVRRTIEAAMGSVSVLPAGRTLYVARAGGWSGAASPAATIAVALAARAVAPAHLSPATLEHFLSPERLADAERWASLDEVPNRDLAPTTYRRLLERAEAEQDDAGLETLAGTALVLALVALFVVGPRRRPLHLAVMTSGASGLCSQLVLMVAYQTATGALYREMGLCLAGFMAGAAIGACLRLGDSRRTVVTLELAMVLLALLGWVALPWLMAHGQWGRALLFATTALAGFLPGAEFAVAGRLLPARPGLPGALYAADLAGAGLAALVVFTVGAPTLGLGGLLVALAALKLASAANLLLPQPDSFGTRLPIAALVLVALVLGALGKTWGPLYALTFAPPYQWIAVLTLGAVALVAFEPARFRRARVARRLQRLHETTGLTVGRLLLFVLLAPLAAFPIARCYFRVPFLFCHVCPRPCAFGALRFFIVPAALLGNLRGQRFCEKVCPLGAAQRFAGWRARRLAGTWVPRTLAVLLVAALYFWVRADHHDGISGGPLFTLLFRNEYAPSLTVLVVAGLLLALSAVVRRPFCEVLCPVGGVSVPVERLVKRLRRPRPAAPALLTVDRRLFLERSLAGCSALVLGGKAFEDLVAQTGEPRLGLGFRNDAPAELDAFSRPARFAAVRGALIQCTLCPHACILGENDRGFCRTRVVKQGRLHTLAYGNLCSLALDPIEKKPLYHYLPRTPILSVAMGGCNLRCLNCQNWEISQARPHEVFREAILPDHLVRLAGERQVPSIAYTYSEPLVAYEYVRDAAAEARAKGVKNVLVTAGYIEEKPLRELCRSVDAVTLDVKAFRDSFYRSVSGGRLAPVLRTLEVLREERVWTEVSFLMVPSLSDDPAEIGRFAGWMAAHLGAGTPLHILRFHPAHRLRHLAWTPIPAMVEARRRALDAGLEFVYLGNVPGNEANHTWCPRDGRLLIERNGFEVTRFEIVGGRCPCGQPIPGVFDV